MYGFRKIKTEEDIKSNTNSKVWRFKHDNFRQGREDLLTQVYRTSKEAPRVENLEKEVETLKTTSSEQAEQVETLKKEVETLKALLGLEAQTERDGSNCRKKSVQGECHYKKRKMGEESCDSSQEYSSSSEEEIYAFLPLSDVSDNLSDVSDNLSDDILFDI